MKIEIVLIPVNLLRIKVCFRFLTFDILQDKYSGCVLLVSGNWHLASGHRRLASGCWRLAPGNCERESGSDQPATRDQ